MRFHKAIKITGPEAAFLVRNNRGAPTKAAVISFDGTLVRRAFSERQGTSELPRRPYPPQTWAGMHAAVANTRWRQELVVKREQRALLDAPPQAIRLACCTAKRK